METLLTPARTAAALAAILLIAAVGRAAARALRQPEVIGEVTVGLLAGPAVVLFLGRDGIQTLLPAQTFDLLKLAAQAGIALFMVGLAHELRIKPDGPGRRSVAWTTLGALALPLLSGLLLAGALVAWDGPGTVRGSAPLPAFVLMTAVAMSISSVPVLARMLAERNLTGSRAGRLALTAGILVDSLGWLLVTVALSLRSGNPSDSLRSVTTLAGAALATTALGALLRTGPATRFVERRPTATAVAVGAAALASATAMAQLGMTALLGAVLVGLALPTGDHRRWQPVIASVTRAGKVLVPAFFVTTGITVLSDGIGSLPWALVLLTLLLAFLGKGLGGYVGTRLGGESRPVAIRVGILMNTRGLTELIVLQVALSSGILPTDTVRCLLVMTLVTTAATGPLLGALERREQRRRAVELLPLDLEGNTR
ncbi:cation:proton antiporter [Kitasatospora sp. NPDC054795]